MHLLGIDVGSSSVKVSLVRVADGRVVGSAFFPGEEMRISAPRKGWAEQDPEQWWGNFKLALAAVREREGAAVARVRAIGISYQMHGLVMVDRAGEVIRPAIIWCDSRAAETGERAFAELGPEFCRERLLNSPGNFTAAKLAWVRENEPEAFARMHKFMLPGDYLAMRLSGETQTTMSGLSEAVLWDFRRHEPAGFLLDYFGIPAEAMPEIVPTFGVQGRLRPAVAAELGLPPETVVSYRAGDQPNNALSLNVLRPGEVAATAGTSGVVFGVSGEARPEPQSRVNSFAHVNHGAADPRLGVLLCINGTGILNAWLRNCLGGLDYAEMNRLAAAAPVGGCGLRVLPFGNGAERVLGNRNIGARMEGLDFNSQDRGHLLRAAQEGIVFAFQYGMEIMAGIGIQARVIRAGRANMFLSPLFREALATTSGAGIELFDTDGAAGAARGAGVGAGAYGGFDEAAAGLEKLETVEPDDAKQRAYREAYAEWKGFLARAMEEAGEAGEAGETPRETAAE